SRKFSTPLGEVPFSSLSLGYRTMAAWLTDFIKRMHESYPDLDEPDDGPAIVIIDEFDLHMHPRWQRKAMAALGAEFPRTQFIVSAHSPIVVQATGGEAKLIILKRKTREDGLEEVEVIDGPENAAG
ncbi:MAG: putative ATP-binding protein involved in virulence, partial [Verrucomicrobiales bacterium]